MTAEEAKMICDLMWQADTPCEYVAEVRKSLEKQIPKKKHKYMGYRCVCGNEVAKNQDYCEFCGQRLEPFEETKHDMWNKV